MKESENIPKDSAPSLADSYFDALEKFLAGEGEDALRSAYELGRRAVAEGLGVLEMAAMHHAALAGVLPDSRNSSSLASVLHKAEEFFLESLSPYEMTHRGFGESVAALRRLNETLEQEIQRIAHAVHDEAGQLLVAARLSMSGVARDLPAAHKSRLREVNAILDQVEDQLRRLSHELRPTILDELGLAPALQFLADGVSLRTKLRIRVESSVENLRVPKLETAVYRVVQEALTNIARHAKASNVRIELSCEDGTLRCRILDDGIGFDPHEASSRKKGKGLGLIGIRERLNAVGGTFQIHSRHGQGTDLRVMIPMEK